MKENTLNSVSKFLCLQEIKRLFRIVEVLLILIFLTWSCNRLPFAVRISGEYFRQLLNVVVSHVFIFLLGNLLVLTLFFKSRHLLHKIEADNLDFVENGPHYFTGEINSPPLTPVEIVYRDKKTIFEVANVVKVQKRSLSENFRRSDKNGSKEGSNCSDCQKQLRRSETEKWRRRVAVEDVDVEIGNEMSNEEFQRAIDNFIAKQIKFHQQEKTAIVLHATTT